MAARISWNWCRAFGGVSSRYEARHHRPDRADPEGRTRGGGDRDPARAVRGVVVGTGVEGWARDKRRQACRCDTAHPSLGGGGRGGGGGGGGGDSCPRTTVPGDQVADGRDFLSVA